MRKRNIKMHRSLYCRLAPGANASIHKIFLSLANPISLLNYSPILNIVITMNKGIFRTDLILFSLTFALSLTFCQQGFSSIVGGPETVANSRYQPITGVHGMVVSDDRTASEW